MENANTAYRDLLARLLIGSTYSPRGLSTRECVGLHTRVDMQHPIVTIPARKLNYGFMAAEAHWILSGERSLNREVLKKRLLPYSDDGHRMAGAYGPPFIQQLPYVVAALNEDKETRQAVITLWERSPRKSLDIPCTVALQLIIRDNLVHTNVFMRSSDAWLGWPYDIFSFTMMTMYVMLHTRHTNVDLGNLSFFAGSSHIYCDKIHKVQQVVETGDVGDILGISLSTYFTPDHLLQCLGHTPDDPRVESLAYLRRELCH